MDIIVLIFKVNEPYEVEENNTSILPSNLESYHYDIKTIQEK